MVQRLIAFLAMMGLLLLLRRFLGRMRGLDPRARVPRDESLPVEGKMVRDRVCNTFLPESRALIERDALGTHFFCSDTCRRTFLERARP